MKFSFISTLVSLLKHVPLFKNFAKPINQNAERPEVVDPQPAFTALYQKFETTFVHEYSLDTPVGVLAGEINEDADAAPEPVATIPAVITLAVKPEIKIEEVPVVETPTCIPITDYDINPEPVIEIKEDVISEVKKQPRKYTRRAAKKTPAKKAAKKEAVKPLKRTAPRRAPRKKKEVPPEAQGFGF